MERINDLSLLFAFFRLLQLPSHSRSHQIVAGPTSAIADDKLGNGERPLSFCRVHGDRHLPNMQIRNFALSQPTRAPDFRRGGVADVLERVQ
jgi:hypothetical protein